MEPRSPNLGPSPYSALPDPCDRCKQTICFFLHTYSASACPYSLCTECRELEALDAQITDIQDMLINLSNRRHELKGRINRRHDRFTSGLPVELVSDIFSFIVQESSESDPLVIRENNQGLQWNPVLMLGGVCKRWREITLATPILWTQINIGPRKDTPFCDFTDQWLSRSGSLPLFLRFHNTIVEVDDPRSGLSELTHIRRRTHIFPPANSVQLLQSHANRWKHLNLIGTTAMLPMIVRGMEDRIVMDSLRIDTSLDEKKLKEDISRYPFVPKYLHIRKVPVPDIPVQWDRLTYLKTEEVCAEDLLHVIRHAHNLQTCVLHYIGWRWDNRSYDPISPLTNHSVKEFDVRITYSDHGIRLLLGNLTFPSLEVLRYSRSAYRDREDLNALSNLLNRSQPPLHDFSFCDRYTRDSAHSFNWSSLLPSITSLDLDIHSATKGSVKVYIDSLGAHVEPMAFPRLRDLKIHLYGGDTEPDWWHGLAAVFPDSQIDQNAPTPMFSRPLKTVTVIVSPPLYGKIMERATRSRLRAIRDSGVDIEVLNIFNHKRIDILGSDVR